MTRPFDLRSYDDGVDRWDVASTAAAGLPAGSVDRYTWWSERTISFTARRELASTGGVFIVNLGEPIEIVDAIGDTHRIGAGEGFAGGIAQATSISRSTGAAAGIHVHVPPATLARLLGLPLAALRDRVATLDTILGREALVLGERLLAASSHEARWRLLDAYIAARLASACDNDREIGHAWRALARGRRVEAVADDLGWSRKRLAQRFHEATGMLPRSFAGLARFERFTAALQAQPQKPMAAAAIDAGYADQSHLTRAVARYAALSPSALRARLIPAGGGVRE